MNRLARTCLLLVAIALGSCTSIPAEAPELSAQLGTRITAIELAHTRLVEQFFSDKRRRVDEFIEEVWVPSFASDFFGDPRVDQVWRQVIASQDPQDRLRFIVMVGPRLQSKINAKRIDLIAPLDDLERDVKARLKVDYDQARAINNTLTSFLQSAAKVEENRKRYLEMLGITEDKVDNFIDETDDAVSELLDTSEGAQDKVKVSEAFVEKLKAIAAKVKS